MEITKREVLFSIIITALMLLVGLFIGGVISDRAAEDNERYYKAVKINGAEQFQYALKTAIGNALVYGEITAESPVSMPEITGEWFYIEKVEERYTMHTRTVTTTDSKGKTSTRVETYWSWDWSNSDEKRTEEFRFMGMSFNNPLSGLPVEQADLSELAADGRNVRGNYLYKSKTVRYYFKIVPNNFYATVEAKIGQNQISGYDGKEQIHIRPNTSIPEFIDSLEKGEFTAQLIFWIIWSLITVFAVVAFCRTDNDWLEDR